MSANLQLQLINEFITVKIARIRTLTLRETHLSRFYLSLVSMLFINNKGHTAFLHFFFFIFSFFHFFYFFGVLKNSEILGRFCGLLGVKWRKTRHTLNSHVCVTHLYGLFPTQPPLLCYFITFQPPASNPHTPVKFNQTAPNGQVAGSRILPWGPPHTISQKLTICEFCGISFINIIFYRSCLILPQNRPNITGF